ncbi:MAG: 5-formyltetrahydrofolate cyclo-ligase [Pseudomonadota bacterium]
MDSRQALRKKLREQRANLTLSEQDIATQKVTKHLIQDSLFHQSQNIAAYIPINNEINAKIIIEKIWENHKRCYLPVLQHKKLVFCVYERDTPLKNNRFNILEPPLDPEFTINPYDLDLVLVPLLGFTMSGKRLGMGGGFYDRTFSFLLDKTRPNKPYLIGLAYEWQKLETETWQERNWDVPLDAIVTEKKIYTQK